MTKNRLILIVSYWYNCCELCYISILFCKNLEIEITKDLLNLKVR